MCERRGPCETLCVKPYVKILLKRERFPFLSVFLYIKTTNIMTGMTGMTGVSDLFSMTIDNNAPIITN